MILAEHGLRVAVVERGEGLGGTCLFEGCIPSKIFLESAHRLEDIRQRDEFALMGPAEVRLDLSRLQARKQAILRVRVEGARQRAEHAGLNIVRGHGQLLDPHTIEVITSGEERRRLQGRYLLLAPGSETSRPPIPGVEAPGLWTSEDALASEELPDSLVIVGGGYIGCELAAFFAAVGTRVTMVEMLPRLLETEDPLAAAAVQSSLVRRGVAVHTGSRVERISRNGAGWKIRFTGADGGPGSAAAARVLLAVGRRPRTAELAWDRAGLSLGRRGEVPVNRFYQTSVPHIYVTGDANGQVMLAHAATRQSEIAAWHMLGTERQVDPLVIPHVIFTEPEVASVGLDSRACADDRALAAFRYPYAADARARIVGDAAGFVQLVWKPETHELRGVQVVGTGAGELLAEATNVLRRGGLVDELTETVHSHPTLGEVVAEAAAAALAGQGPRADEAP